MVDDDEQLCLVVSERLSADGHSLDIVHTGEDAHEYLATGDYDLVVLDWSLPKCSGVEVLRRYRAAGGQTPIIMLTGNATVREKEEGLDSGADDYLTKPFSTRELSARIRALLRRPAAIASDVLKVQDLELDPTAHKVRKNGLEIHLQPADFALLEFFMRNTGAVFGPEVIIQRVWGHDSEASIDSLRTAIKRIRQKIDTGGDESASLIETIPRVGYGMRK
jgi:two-component system OmpR family response regulator